MPVNFRVLVNGFDLAERRELETCFGPRSLIAYLPAETLADADLVLVDSDDVATLQRAQRLLHPRNVLFVGRHQPAVARWHLPRPVDGAAVLGKLDELVATEKPTPHAFADNFLSLVRPTGDSLTFTGFDLRERSSSASVTAAAEASPPIVISDPDAPATAPSPEPLSQLHAELEALADMPAPPSGRAGALTASDEPRPFAAIDLGAVDREVGDAWPVLPDLGSTPAERRSAKATMRAAVRRAQRDARGLAQPTSTAALVLEKDAAARLAMAELLGFFGFQPVTATTIAEATRVLGDRAFGVAFIGAVDDAAGEAAGIELCHRVKQRSIPLAGPAPKVIMLWPQTRPADRVRARLAGCDHFVTGTADRGAVARSLEAVGLAMPCDPRGVVGASPTSRPQPSVRSVSTTGA